MPYLAFFLTLCLLKANAQQLSLDSLPALNLVAQSHQTPDEQKPYYQPIVARPTLQTLRGSKLSLHLGLIGSAGFLEYYDPGIRQFRNKHFYKFRQRYDDYVQYLPATTVFIRKLINKKQRKTLKRTLLSYAISYAIMGLCVNSLKKITGVQRPDGSTFNSFPSGHAATAFMNARFMDREFRDANQWYTTGAYMAASSVGVGRMLNNRHWASDVVVGASMGVLAVEAGYFITDKILK